MRFWSHPMLLASLERELAAGHVGRVSCYAHGRRRWVRVFEQGPAARVLLELPLSPRAAALLEAAGVALQPVAPS